jgi:hypothetical protein
MYVPAAFSINNLAHIYVGGVDATIVYQGASGFPGLNQVNVTIPANAPQGCNVSLTGVTAAGIPTNTITLPIGTGANCSDTTFGISGLTYQNLSQQATVKTGFVGLSQSTFNGQVTNAAFASFQSYTGAFYGTASGSVSLGGCIVNQALGTTGTVGTTIGLDPGTITVSPPSGVGSNVNLTGTSTAPGFYFAQLPTGFIPPTGGLYSFHSTGGTTSQAVNVGAFTTNVSFSNPLMTWTNQSTASTVTRANGLAVTWSGGAVNSFVIISGSASSGGVFASFTCIVPGSTSQFNVPGYVTSALPSGNGSVTVSSYTNYNTFTATGIDFGAAAGYISYGVTSTFN